MSLKQKIVYGAGVTSTPKIGEITGKVNLSDQGGKVMDVPKSPYSISESQILIFTNKIVGRNSKNLNIADGERRPGTK